MPGPKLIIFRQAWFCLLKAAPFAKNLYIYLFTYLLFTKVEFNATLGKREFVETEPSPPKVPAPLPKRRHLTDINPDERKRRLENQMKTNPWHRFVQGNLILKQVIFNKTLFFF
jgi:hypothetical protein